jgi:hypothetical protein
MEMAVNDDSRRGPQVLLRLDPSEVADKNIGENSIARKTNIHVMKQEHQAGRSTNAQCHIRTIAER